jgi:hypothetical protein
LEALLQQITLVPEYSVLWVGLYWKRLVSTTIVTIVVGWFVGIEAIGLCSIMVAAILVVMTTLSS